MPRANGDTGRYALVFWLPRVQGSTMTAACRSFQDDHAKKDYGSWTDDDWSAWQAACKDTERFWRWPKWTFNA